MIRVKQLMLSYQSNQKSQYSKKFIQLKLIMVLNQKNKRWKHLAMVASHAIYSFSIHLHQIFRKQSMSITLLLLTSLLNLNILAQSNTLPWIRAMTLTNLSCLFRRYRLIWLSKIERTQRRKKREVDKELQPMLTIRDNLFWQQKASLT